MGHVVYCRTYSSGPVKTKIVFLKRQGDCYTTFGLYRVWHLEIMPIFSDKFSLLSKGKKLKLVSKKCMVGSTGRGWGDNCYRHCFGRRRQKLQHRKLEILIYRYITKISSTLHKISQSWEDGPNFRQNLDHYMVLFKQLLLVLSPLFQTTNTKILCIYHYTVKLFYANFQFIKQAPIVIPPRQEIILYTGSR